MDHTIPKKGHVGQQDSTHQFRQKKVQGPVTPSALIWKNRTDLDPWPVCITTYIPHYLLIIHLSDCKIRDENTAQGS